MIYAEEASVPIAHEKGKGVEGAISGVLEHLANLAIITVNISEGETPPGDAESALVVSTGSTSPKKTETDEVTVGDAFLG
jgi:exosome complex RNA-binding protein Csl4